MENEREILVCYDIHSNRKREKLRKELKELGLVSIQKSVMWGHLLPSELRAAQRLLKQYANKPGDKGFIAFVNLSTRDLQFQVGHEHDFKRYEEPYIVI
jgi:CRISPR-associated protein Cas2